MNPIFGLRQPASPSTAHKETSIMPFSNFSRSLSVRVWLIAVVVAAVSVLGATAADAASWELSATHESSSEGTVLVRNSSANPYTLKIANASLNVGDLLTCEPGAWANSTGFTYQWLRNGNLITGATSSGYTAVATDAGAIIQCRVAATNAGGGASATSSVLTTVNPIPSSAPTAPPVLAPPSGTATAGNELTCPSSTAWTGNPTFTYQWLRNGTEIAGATSSTYEVQAADVPGAIQCQVTGTNAAGGAAKLSAVKNTTPAPSPPVPTGGVPAVYDNSPDAVAGGQEVGQTLTCAGGPATATTVNYQWLRNGAPISAATASTYVLTGTDAGTSIQCQVTAANANAGSQAVSKPPVAVAPAPSLPAPTPPTGAIPAPSGTASAGQTLTCAPGTWTGSPTFTYQWLRNGIPIVGATASTYVVQAADVPGAIQCQVTGTNVSGSAAADSALKNTTPAPTPVAPTATAVVTGPDSVTVSINLPQGLLMDGVSGTGGACSATNPCELSGTGWACTPTAGTCTRSDLLQAGAVYPPITMNVRVNPDAPDLVTPAFSVSGGGASTATFNDPTEIAAGTPFQVASFTTSVVDQGEAPYTQAGGHPYEASASIAFPTTIDAGGAPQVVANPKTILTNLPPGLLGNPAVTPQCPLAKISSSSSFAPSACPISSAVGTINLAAGRGGESLLNVPVYNMVPEWGFPAEFGFTKLGKTFFLYPQLRSDGSYAITIRSLAAQNSIESVTVSFCGDGVTLSGSGAASCTLPSDPGARAFPFLTNPTDCAGAAPVTTLSLDSWESPGRLKPDGEPDLSDPSWKTGAYTSPALTGCDQLSFAPTIDATPDTTKADAPTGLGVDLKVPQTNDPTDLSAIGDSTKLATPPLKDATVKLPSGLAISPSSANGLESCGDGANLGEPNQAMLGSSAEAHCPEGSKIGTVTVDTPLLGQRNLEANSAEYGKVTGPEPVAGAIYVLTPHTGDFSGGGQGGIFRLMIQVRSDRYGLNVKLPGTVKADPLTGQLTATFDQNPQLPFSDLKLQFKGGPRAPLATPVTCGSYSLTSDLRPWSSPETPDATPSDSFGIDGGANGLPCAATPQARPFAPALSAGTENPGAGASSPFVLKVTRNDGEQELSSLNVTTPKGFTARLAGVSYCPEAAIAAATTRSGVAEQQSPSCPAASQVGIVTAGAGPGTNPYYVSGKAYLSGPYKGTPISMVFVTPAVAGPFDLGNVVVRTALEVNPETAQVTVKSDPIPQILDGVPLQIRSIAVDVNRPDFTRNPTSCEPMSVTASISGSSGVTASPANRFQVGGCDKLGFGPKLKIQLKGATGRIGHPALKAVVTTGAGEANIGRAQVNLPHGEFLDQGNLNKTCTKPVLMAGSCPANSIYGYAKAWTPLLAEPLQGPVYLVGGYGYKLPALVAELNGQIKVLLVGKVDSGKNKGIRNTFEVVPDAPVEKFELSMKGGKKYGLLENSENLCKASKANRRAIVRFTGQNGKVRQFKSVVANQCGKAKKHKKKHAKHAAAKPGADNQQTDARLAALITPVWHGW
jgi:hypothetical protein